MVTYICSKCGYILGKYEALFRRGLCVDCVLEKMKDCDHSLDFLDDDEVLKQ